MGSVGLYGTLGGPYGALWGFCGALCVSGLSLGGSGGPVESLWSIMGVPMGHCGGSVGHYRAQEALWHLYVAL